MDIRVSIDRKTGRATFTRVRTVVEEELLENYQAEFTVEQAKQYMENPEVGQQYIEEVPPVEMAASPRNLPSRSFCKKSAKPSGIVNMKNSRTVLARLSMDW
jgi:hypothetical protein